LIRALSHEDLPVARDAARALGALGGRAGPSVPYLVKALYHRDPMVRLYVAEALASIGPDAAAATPDLTKALRDPEPRVRWAACEALAAIGPPAAAVPDLMRPLRMSFFTCASARPARWGASDQDGAVAALKAAANDPAMRRSEWALHQIAGLRGRNSHLPCCRESAVRSRPFYRDSGAARRRAAGGKGIRRTIGTYKPAGISSGVLPWGTRRLVAQWSPEAWFTWERTTRGS
jgi:hypothetical protein